MKRTRVSFPGALFHVIARGNRNQPIFLGRPDYTKYLELLGEDLEKGGMRLFAYCLMPNHIHLLLEQVGEAPLSRFMQKLQTGYTLYFNHRHRKEGHLFRDRYQAILADPDRYLKELVRYIQMNPVRSKLAKIPEEYPWTGHHQYIRKLQDPPARVAQDWVLRHFGDNPKQSRKAYQRFVLEGLEEGHRKDLYAVRDGYILGDSDFVEKVRARVSTGQAEPKLRVLLELPDIWKALLRREGLDREPKGWRRSALRAEAAYLATEFCGINQREVGKFFGMEQSSISRALGRLVDKWDKDPEAREKWMEWARGLERSDAGGSTRTVVSGWAAGVH